jgi:hypothetical protein
MSITEITARIMHPVAEYVEVTPSMASEWLTKNTHNRPLRPGVVQRYTKDMVNGLWRHPTGEAIIFDRLGRLQQGQHRLTAVIKSGCTITFLVVTNADPADFTVIDSGAARSAGDVLSMAGVLNGKNVAAIARNLRLMSTQSGSRWSGSSATRMESLDTAMTYRVQLEEASRMAQAANRAAKVPPAAYGAVMAYVMVHSDTCVELHEFHDAVVTGEMQKSGDPAYALRRWGITRPPGQGSALNQQMVAVCTKAWNAFTDEREQKVLVWRKGEPFPLPKPARY